MNKERVKGRSHHFALTGDVLCLKEVSVLIGLGLTLMYSLMNLAPKVGVCNKIC